MIDFKDRKFGIWDKKDSTILDDLAYNLYCNDMYENFIYNEVKGHMMYRQTVFCKMVDNKDYRYYKEAKTILRYKKLKNLKNLNNDT